MDEKQQAVLEKTLTEVIEKGLEGVDAQIDAKFKQLMEDHKDAFTVKSDVPKNHKEATSESEKFAKIGAFIRAVKSGETKGMTEGTDSAGGYLVPEEFNAEVIRIAKDYGLAFKFAQRFPMSSDTLNVPVESTSVTVYWPGEATVGTASQPALGNAQLLAKTLMGITVTSNELLSDSKVDVIKYLTTIFAEAMAGEVDNQAFNGTGSPFTGILSDAGVTVVTMASGQDTFAETKLTDLRTLIANIPVSCLPTSAFYMHPLTWGLIQNIQEDSTTVAAINHNPVTVYGPLNIGVGQDEVKMLSPAGYLWGYPVYLSDKIVSTTAVSTKFVVFGSFQKGLFLGDREQMTLDINDKGSVSTTNVWTSNQSAVRVTQRVALKVGLPTAFAALKTAAS